MSGEGRDANHVRAKLVFLATHRYGLATDQASKIVESHRREDGSIFAEAALREIRRCGGPPRALVPPPCGSRLSDEEILMLRIMIRGRRSLSDLVDRIRHYDSGTQRWQEITRGLREY